MKMIRLSKYGKLAVYVALVIYLIIVIVPFVMTIMNSFKSLANIFLEPFSFSSLTFQNFVTAFKEANIITGYINSIIIVTISSAGIIIVSSMLAYAISRFDFPFRRALIMYSMVGLALPVQLAIVPIYAMMNSVHLLNTRLGLILIYIAFNISFSSFILRNFIDYIPVEIEEAALIEGASRWKIFWYIVIPMIKPALAIVAIVNFTNIWNDFFLPLIFINSNSKVTLTLAVSVFFQAYSNQWNLLFASLTLAMLPMLIFYFILSKQFIAGITAGAIK